MYKVKASKISQASIGIFYMENMSRDHVLDVTVILLSCKHAIPPDELMDGSH
jgi:hypothetical protein